MKTHNLESELLEPVKRWLSEQGCEIVVPELRFFDRGIDVYGIRAGRMGRTMAVELKLTAWQRALQQAAVYQLCADLCYVAMPIMSALKLDIRPFKQCGVGILLVRRDGTVGTLLEPARSTEIRKDYVKALGAAALEGVSHATV